MSNQDRDAELARRGRVVALVIAGAGLVALLAPWITAKLDLTPRFEMLLYLGAMGAFVWAIAVTYQIWRSRND